MCLGMVLSPAWSVLIFGTSVVKLESWGGRGEGESQGGGGG